MSAFTAGDVKRTNLKTKIWGGAFVASAVPPVVLWTAAVPVGGRHLMVETAGTVQPVGLVSVIVAAVVACAAGMGLVTLLCRRTTKATAIWLVASPLVLLLSLLGTLNATTTTGTLTLISLHCVVGIPVIAAGRALARLG
ncbi:MAG TPA: hypothetical protein H9881_03465 [Candidatus Stackebrandtia excrementipullorum]|nr:hypothetical protein [Candidatus Stackebrandtia excrementipullorum]